MISTRPALIELFKTCIFQSVSLRLSKNMEEVNGILAIVAAHHNETMCTFIQLGRVHTTRIFICVWTRLRWQMLDQFSLLWGLPIINYPEILRLALPPKESWYPITWASTQFAVKDNFRLLKPHEAMGQGSYWSKNCTCSQPIKNYGRANGKNHYIGKRSIIWSDYNQVTLLLVNNTL